jgi:hypothetical protein
MPHQSNVWGIKQQPHLTLGTKAHHRQSTTVTHTRGKATWQSTPQLAGQRSTNGLIARTQATNKAQTMEPAQPQHQQRRPQAGEHIARNPTRQLPSPTSGITHTLLELINSTTRTWNVYWSTPVATATDHTHLIKLVSPPQVIATMAPTALAQQHTLVAQPWQDHKSTPAFPLNLIKIIRSIRATVCP